MNPIAGGMRMRRGFHLIALALLLVGIGVAQETPKHAIDKALEACLDKNQSTAGMVECEDKAYLKWDKELNRLYAELMKKISPDAKAALKDAQVQWLKFRDSEFKLLDGIYDKLEGTMYRPMRVDSRLEIVKRRALELNSHLELLKDSQ
jgi:uncharacterized protein YecT (DUF1311 family)